LIHFENVGTFDDVRILGLENHLNYIYKVDGQLSKKLTFGLSAFLNSKLFDSYFRITNGNTQASATELRSAAMPPMSKLEEIGMAVSGKKNISHQEIDAIVSEILGRG